MRLLLGAANAIRQLNERAHSGGGGHESGRRHSPRLLSGILASPKFTRLDELLLSTGARIDGYYVCLHHPDAACECRKPNPGLLHRAATELGLDLAGSCMIGDKESDCWKPVHEAPGAGRFSCEPATACATIDPDRHSRGLERVGRRRPRSLTRSIRGSGSLRGSAGKLRSCGSLLKQTSGSLGAPLFQVISGFGRFYDSLWPRWSVGSAVPADLTTRPMRLTVLESMRCTPAAQSPHSRLLASRKYYTKILYCQDQDRRDGFTENSPRFGSVGIQLPHRTPNRISCVGPCAGVGERGRSRSRTDCFGGRRTRIRSEPTTSPPHFGGCAKGRIAVLRAESPLAAPELARAVAVSGTAVDVGAARPQGALSAGDRRSGLGRTPTAVYSPRVRGAVWLTSGHTPAGGGVPYGVFVLPGVVLWQLFAGTITQATASLVTNQHLIGKVFFPDSSSRSRPRSPTSSILSSGWS